MRLSQLILIAFLFVSAGLGAQPVVKFDTVVSGLSQPIHITHAGDSRIFVCERAGRIRIVNNGSLVTAPFLNISGKVSTSGEGGLLGLAFHPDYASNGYLYVNYTRSGPGGFTPMITYISRFTRDAVFPDSANWGSEFVIDTIHQPFTNHKGGDLSFGPDGYLYVMMGDGGDGGDPFNNAQHMRRKLGKVLRYDVDGGSPYAIPADNPYQTPGDTVPDLIWAAGLRNPFRFSFDRETGDIWIGDVGQGAREEIDYIPAGEGAGWNFGWRCYEGKIPYNTSNCGPYANYNGPVRDYGRTYSAGSPEGGRTVTGGYVYRGSEFPFLEGYYLHADYISSKVWGLKEVLPDSFQNTYFGDLAPSLVGFGEDSSGELYAVSISNGRLLKVRELCQGYIPEIDQTGAVLTGTTSGPGASWQWYYQNDSIIGATSASFTPEALGPYHLRLKTSNGCTVFSDTFDYLLPGQVFFSEYIEGSADNRCLEIYNGTSALIDLTTEGYAVDLYSDGSSLVSSSTALAGTIAPGQVHVICHPGANAAMLAQADQTSMDMSFSGNDAIVLRNASTAMIDVFGQIGFNPGTGWPGSCSSEASADHTLIRRGSVTSGDTNGADIFNATPEWICAPQDYVSDLGLHPGEALPIKLEYIRAERGPAVVDVEWRTASEDGVSHFMLGRSKDGRVFEEIAEVRALGGKSSPAVYQYADMEAGSDKTFYRLKMVDANGDFSYSNVIGVAAISGALKILRLYPQPASGEITLDLQVEHEAMHQLEWLNSSGMVLYQEEKWLSSGPQQWKQYLHDWPSGMYVLRLSTADQSDVRQVMLK